MKTFAYLGSTLAEDGKLDAEVTHRVQSGWKNWKRVSGVLCDRTMNVKVERGREERERKRVREVETGGDGEKGCAERSD